MSKLREQIRAKMEGFEFRREQREGARRVRRSIARVYAARERGELSTLQKCQQWMKDNAIPHPTILDRGYSMITVNILGVVLTYGPDRKLQKRDRRVHLPVEQFTFESPGSSSVSPCEP